MYNNKQSANTFIRNMYSPGFSCLRLSLFKMNLTFCFNPYTGTDNRGLSQYCKKTFLSTTINYEGAALFYFIAMSIVKGTDSDTQIEATVQCNNNTSLTFEYKPDQNNQMTAYMVIRKNDEVIPFMFSSHPYTVRENGQMVTKVIQSELIAFAKILDGYLSCIGAERHFSKLTDEDFENQ